MGGRPLDVGTGVVCASLTDAGDWLSLGGVHPLHGFAELSGMPPFDERLRGDPEATRRYRAAMADPRHAFLSVRAPRGVTLRADPVARPGAAEISQRWELSPADEIVLAVRPRLDRPALAEITELDPPAPTGARTRLAVHGPRLLVVADAPPATAWIEARDASGAPVAGWQIEGAEASLRLALDGTATRFEVRCGLETGLVLPGSSNVALPVPSVPGPSPAGAAAVRRLIVPAELEPDVKRIAAASLRYVAGCTALLAGGRERCLLTDHRLLPLSWTRDAYYQALLLLAADGGAPIVADHLRWLWLRCERPDGRWVRSHHANGARKDLAYQADQQLYPLLELADYRRAAGRLPDLTDSATDDLRSWRLMILEAWRAAEQASDPDRGFLASEENAADDPAELPYLFASQVLAWYTARRVLELGAELDLAELDLVGTATRLATAAEAFRIETASGPLWAYAIDREGRHLLYHDANDLPTALAPLWGFCSQTDPAWLGTMRFAFSPANPASVDGPLGGLGSLHTPGTWPLGDVQDWVAASLADDPQRAEAALLRLSRAATRDGLLPEAYDPRDGGTLARHWFAWPGAALGGLWLLDRRGLLTERLAVDGIVRSQPG